MTYYRITFERRFLDQMVPVPNAIALDKKNEGPDKVGEALESHGYSSVRIIDDGSKDSLSNKFAAYRTLAADADDKGYRHESFGDIEWVWQK
jgi:hypothetical protein